MLRVQNANGVATPRVEPELGELQAALGARETSD